MMRKLNKFRMVADDTHVFISDGVAHIRIELTRLDGVLGVLNSFAKELRGEETPQTLRACKQCGRKYLADTDDGYCYPVLKESVKNLSEKSKVHRVY